MHRWQNTYYKFMKRLILVSYFMCSFMLKPLHWVELSGLKLIELCFEIVVSDVPCLVWLSSLDDMVYIL